MQSGESAQGAVIVYHPKRLQLSLRTQVTSVLFHTLNTQAANVRICSQNDSALVIFEPKGRGGVPEGDEGSTLVGLKLAPVHPPGDRVSGIGGPPQHHGGTSVVLKQGPILAQKSGVRALEDLPRAIRPQGPYEELSKEAHELVALVWLQQQQHSFNDTNLGEFHVAA